MKKIPIDVGSFDILRTQDYVYVDKTKYLYNLVTEGRFYFLSRPRRFGKSLFISTLKELFLGNRYLFKDLWIDKESTYSWTPYPVIHLDFSQLSFSNSEELKKSLSWELEQMALEYGLDVSGAPTPGLKLKALIKFLSKKNLVAILIDEYDYPLISKISDIAIAQENHEVLHSFYSALKGMDGSLRAVFVTGVTKFSKTSLFSGLNNLNDISFDPRAALLFGYTKEEIEENFPQYLDKLAENNKTTVNQTLHEMKEWYNGYRFSEKPLYVYNPFSVLYCLHKEKFANYWFETGTPSFVVDLLKKHYQELEDIDEIALSSSALGPFEIGDLPIIPILFQTGYLTISHVRRIKQDIHAIDIYTLKYPNLEVAESFKKYLIAALSHSSYRMADTAVTELITALADNNIPLFCTTLQSLFAHIPYQLHIPEERYYHSLFQLLASLLKIEAQSEVSTDKGRIDLVLQTKTHIYVFELKFDSDASTALKQIQERKYFERYLLAKKKIILIGLSFNRTKERLNLAYEFEKI